LESGHFTCSFPCSFGLQRAADMALMQELDVNVQDKLSDESKGLAYGEMIRDYDPVEGVKWRFGTPNYTRVNKLYFQHRVKQHPEGSLESVVMKLVKNWEVESHHISDIHQWQTMDIAKFRAALNGGSPANAQLMSDIGPYNMLIGEHSLYSSASQTFQSANTIWSAAFSEGFAFEVLEVLSGPPTCTFKWRHFGKFSGTYTDKEGKTFTGKGQMVNVIGLCIAKVNEALKIEALDVYYNPDDLLTPLIAATTVEDSVAVVGRDEADSKVQTQACCTADKGKDVSGHKGDICSVM